MNLVSRNEQLLWLLLGGAGLFFLWSRTQRGEELLARTVETSVETARDIIGNLTRGERNHNPGNIERGEPWIGLAPEQSDARFATFSDAIYGIRALAKTLLTYQRVHALSTIAQIVNRWAPPAENLTGAYAAAVARDVGVDVNTPLTLSDSNILAALTTAIIHHENGRVIYPSDIIAGGVHAALS
ncbi:MAG: structural protein P5 [Burkholderiales bacterium]